MVDVEIVVDRIIHHANRTVRASVIRQEFAYLIGPVVRHAIHVAAISVAVEHIQQL